MMRYRLITEKEVKPWYVLQEIYARLVGDKILEINSDLYHRIEMYDEMELPTMESRRLKMRMKSGFFDFSSGIPVACERAGPCLLNVYEPRPGNLFGKKRESLIIPVSFSDMRMFSFYPHMEWETIEDLNTLETGVMDINIDPGSPYLEPMDRLMDDFMLEKDIALIRHKDKPQV